MDNCKITTIIFDLGNVLIDFDYNIVARKIRQYSDKSIQEIYSLFFDSGLTRIFEEGKIAPREFFLKIKQLLNLKLEYNKFLPIWNEMFFLSKKNKAVYNLAKGLKNNYKLALLSNINILHLDYLKTNFPVFDAFHKIIPSCQIGTRKPYPLIYKKVLETFQAKAENVFYTDDRPELTEAAKKLGIKSFVFQGLEQLKKDLESLGVKIN